MSAEMWLGVAIGVVGTVVAGMARVVAADWWRRNKPF